MNTVASLPAKWRKKPVVIEAVQWFKLGDHPAVTTAAPDCPEATDKGWIDTLEGGHYVTPGDWIITGVQGEHYPCKPHIFAATYEPAALATPAVEGGIKLRKLSDGEWIVRIGDGQIPELFDTPQSALAAALDCLGIATPEQPGFRMTSDEGGWTKEDALRYIENWCPDYVKDYICSLEQPGSAVQGEVYVEARECSNCGHIGINDSHETDAACHDCEWSGPSPVEDKCPGCGNIGCMTAACPDCGSRYRLAASLDITTPSPAPAAEQGAEDRYEQFIAAGIASSPEPLRELGEYLSSVLDEDEFPKADRLLLQLATATQPEARGVEGMVLAEVERATVKFPTWPTDPLHAVAVLGEEFGELTKAVLQSVYEPHKNPPGAVRTEALQTAAMALRFLASVDRYEGARCPQHKQGEQ